MQRVRQSPQATTPSSSAPSSSRTSAPSATKTSPPGPPRSSRPSPPSAEPSEPDENKLQKSGALFAVEKCAAANHVCHAFHHNLSTKNHPETANSPENPSFHHVGKKAHKIRTHIGSHAIKSTSFASILQRI